MNLGEYINKYRTENKISMDTFASRCGLSKSYISILERNSNPSTGKPISPTIAVIKKIADATYTDFDDLINMLDDNFEIDINDKEKNIYGDHKKNLEYLSDKPELLDLYKDIYESETLQLLFDSAKDLTPQDLETVLILIKGIRKERGLD